MFVVNNGRSLVCFFVNLRLPSHLVSAIFMPSSTLFSRSIITTKVGSLSRPVRSCLHTAHSLFYPRSNQILPRNVISPWLALPKPSQSNVDHANIIFKQSAQFRFGVSKVESMP